MNLLATRPKNDVARLKTYIADVVRAVMDDPDFGLELSSRTKTRLAQSAQSKEKRIPLATLLKRYG